MPRIDEGGGPNWPSGAKVLLNYLELFRDIGVANLVSWLKRPVVRRIEFNRMPEPIFVKSGGLGACTGTAGDVNRMCFTGGSLAYVIKGGATILTPPMTALGLDIGSMDQTNGHGLEIRDSILATTDTVFKVGTSPAFYFETQMLITTVAGTADLFTGFRVQAADQTAVSSYANYASLNVNAGEIYSATNLASAGAVNTDTGVAWANGATHKLKVLVSAAGVVTYQLDGTTLTGAAAYTFPAATVVIPFVHFLQNSTLTGTLPIITWECGLQ